MDLFCKPSLTFAASQNMISHESPDSLWYQLCSLFSFDLQESIPIQSYPVYHTIHDNFRWMTKFVDPDFKYHTIVTKIWTQYTLLLLDSVILPYNLSRYCEDLAKYIEQFEENYQELLDMKGISLGI